MPYPRFMAGPATSDTMAWTLAIETSNPSAEPSSVAGCVEGGEIIETPLAPGRRHDDGLMPAIERLRASLGVEARALSRVCVSIGPGGYTGLRVAVTTAKLIAEATGADLVGVPSAAVVAASTQAQPPFVVCLASKRGVTHATRFAPPSTPDLGEPLGLIDESDLERLHAGVLIADRFLPDPIRGRADELGISVVPTRFQASACLRVGLGLEGVSVSALSPIYAREPEAVRLWRGRGPRFES